MKRAGISAQAPASWLAAILVSCAGVILIGAATVAVALVSLPGTPDLPDPAAAPEQTQARPKTRCHECGEIVSMQQVMASGDSPETFEITVRLRDGSIHVTSDPTPAAWRPGDRIVFMRGANPDEK